MDTVSQESECCPKFNPELWDEKMFDWKNKKFVKEKVFTFFYMPMNFGSVMKRLDRKVREAGATIQDGLGLSDHTSKWNMDLYVAVDKDVPGAQNTSLSGKFLTKVYEGNFRETGNWCNDFGSHVKKAGLEVRKSYMWYTTCPKCAKKYGKNYVAILGELN